MTIELFRLERGDRRLLATVATNGDGRCDGPLLQGLDLVTGQYELVFHVGDYLRAGGLQLSDPPFLDLVPLRFGIADAGAALPRAAAGLALRLFDLSRQLTLEPDGQRRTMNPMRDKVRFLLGHELRRARPGRPDPDGARLAAAGSGAGRAPRKAATRATAVPAPWSSPSRMVARLDYRAVNACIQFVATLGRLPAAHRRGPQGPDGRPAPGAAGDGRLPRLAMRLLHARLRDVDVRPDPRRPTRCRARRRSTTRSPAISAAAPATPRSSARCSRASQSIRAPTRSRLRRSRRWLG